MAKKVSKNSKSSKTNKTRKAKKTGRRAKVNKKPQKNTGYRHMHEIKGIAVTAAGVLLFLSFYMTSEVGIFGNFIKNSLTGLLGITSYLVAPAVFVFGLLVIFKNERIKMSGMIYIFILIAIISAIIQAGYYEKTEYENLSAGRCLVRFFENGKNLQGGGLLGGIVSIPFLYVFKTLGTIIILSTIALIDIILLTEVSLAAAVGSFKINIAGMLKSKNDKRKRRKEDKRQAELSFVDIPDSNQQGVTEKEKKVIDFDMEKEKRMSIKMEGVGKQNDINMTDGDEKREAADTKHEVLYRYPSYSLLNRPQTDDKDIKAFRNEIIKGAERLEETLKSFGVSAKVINVSRGPAVTRYELQPSSGVKVSKIVNLADDISLNMATAEVRIEAPIPGKAAVGIEVPNRSKDNVLLREVLESKSFRNHPSKLAFAMGKDISGECIVSDIAAMPHLLVAGATGAGKSVCINNIIMSILFKATDEEVKMLLIDPKIVELKVYNGIPHMLIPVVTNPRKAAGALNWAVQEMEERYRLFSEASVKDLKSYNRIAENDDESQRCRLPHIVIIIDELSDLMMVAPNEVEDAICRLAQMARAAGMHLVIATQRPSVDVITGVIKANIPSRISFAVSSQVDSRTILDTGGAEKLLGKGDMLFYPVGEPKPLRLQGALVTEREVEKVVAFLKKHGDAEYDEDVIEEIDNKSTEKAPGPGGSDELLPDAIETVIEAGQASVSMIQRKFRVGYARAARIIDQMEERGIVGGFEGSKPRKVLITMQQWLEMDATSQD